MYVEHIAPAGTECDYCDHGATSLFIVNGWTNRTCDVHSCLFTNQDRAFQDRAFSFVMATRTEESINREWSSRMTAAFCLPVQAAQMFGATLEAMTEDRFADLPMPGEPAAYRRTADRVRIYGEPTH